MSKGPWKKGLKPKPLGRRIVSLKEKVAGWLAANKHLAYPTIMIWEQFDGCSYQHVRTSLSELRAEKRVENPVRGYWIHKENDSEFQT